MYLEEVVGSELFSRFVASYIDKYVTSHYALQHIFAAHLTRICLLNVLDLTQVQVQHLDNGGIP